MKAGVPREMFPGERRVAMVPSDVPALIGAGIQVLVESGAGAEAGYPDEAYREKGAETAASRGQVFSESEIILQVRGPGAAAEAGRKDLDLVRNGQVLIGFQEPLSEPGTIRELASRGAVVFAMELIPRITRAQSMDALSSMASISGYKAVLIAASHLPRLFPMMMTAAGTLTAARVFVIGAGVAGLQAIATAKRLGALVFAYDVRPAVKEQVESLGAKFVELGMETPSAQGAGGYAKAMDEDFYRRQREMMARVVADSDAVITTAAVPGRKAPVLVTGEMVRGMRPGSIVVDIAAERGGNCELTRPGETVTEKGVSIAGPLNLPSTVPYHASQAYGKNCANLLLHLVKKGELKLDRADEITKETMAAAEGKVLNPAVLKLLGEEPATENSGGST